MIDRIWTRHLGLAAIGFGLTGVAIYYLMISVTLTHLEAASGHVPFDMRPFGYGPADAETLLNALGIDGRDYYLKHQMPLDTLYPALLALTLVTTICWFGQRMPNSRFVRLGVILSICSALFDYVENLGIMAMIGSWPDVSIPLVYVTSAATIAKSLLTTLAVLMTFLIFFSWIRLPKVQVRFEADVS